MISGDAPLTTLMIDEVTSAKPMTSGDAQLTTLMNSSDAPMEVATHNSHNTLNPNTPILKDPKTLILKGCKKVTFIDDVKNNKYIYV